MRTPHQRLFRLAAAALTAVALLLPAAPAFAHGGGDSKEARVLVVDALAYLANKPDGYLDNVTDKIGDALEAPIPDGVDLAKVEQAKAALDSGDLVAVRTYLTESLEPITEPITGMETGTTAMPDPLAGHTTWNGASWTYTVLCVLAVLLGLALGFRWRPNESLRELRLRLSEEER